MMSTTVQLTQTRTQIDYFNTVISHNESRLYSQLLICCHTLHGSSQRGMSGGSKNDQLMKSSHKLSHLHERDGEVSSESGTFSH